ncbi:MAG: hypothetical protein NTW59_05070 [Candidatus Diapherotrites archaeon]|nr:hypothetical protein [Candidatus Diapherotrites archaeon]
MKAALFFAVLALLLLSGCVQMFSELGACMQTCGNLCQLVNQNNFDLNGFAVGLQKHVGSGSVSCSCPCGG